MIDHELIVNFQKINGIAAFDILVEMNSHIDDI